MLDKSPFRTILVLKSFTKKIAIRKLGNKIEDKIVAGLRPKKSEIKAKGIIKIPEIIIEIDF